MAVARAMRRIRMRSANALRLDTRRRAIMRAIDHARPFDFKPGGKP